MEVFGANTGSNLFVCPFAIYQDRATFSSFTVGSAAQGVFISGEDVIVDDCHIEITAPSAMNVVQIYPASGARNVTIINSVIVAQDNSSNPAGIYWEIGAIA